MRKQLGGRLIVAGVFVFCMARAENKTDISLFFKENPNRQVAECFSTKKAAMDVPTWLTDSSAPYI